MATERTIDRSVLRFAEEVKAQFSYLEASGFRCVRSEATIVRFESPMVGVNVYHGLQSFEIGLEIEPASPTDNCSYSFSEILRLVGCNRDEKCRNYATHTMEGVAEGVRKLAVLFLECVGILNDKELFSRLSLQRQELARDYALETQLEQARRKSEAAWHTKNYAAVVEALRPVRERLTGSEIRKLEYAEKQCGERLNSTRQANN